MNKNKILAVLAACALSVLFYGCATKSSLAPGGVYNSDPYLYNIDASTVAAYDTVDAFLTWEYQNNSYIKTNFPPVFSAANYIRQEAPTAISYLATARLAYVNYFKSTNASIASFQVVSNELLSATTSLQAIATASSTFAASTPIASAFTNTLATVTSNTPSVVQVLTNTNQP